MEYKRILTIQDISCVGQCSLTVALPIMSACGQETCILPSAVLSTHTAFKVFPTVRDLAADIPVIQNHWKKENISFDAIYTGYLGTTEQIDDVANILKTMTVPGGKTIVDPAMADNGKLYAAFDQTYADAMAGLCVQADVVIPNLTEACMMAKCEYKETYDEAYIQDVLSKLHAMGMKCVIMTGVSYTSDETGVLISQNGETFYYSHKKLSRSFHGTGDCYASAFVGAWLGGKSMEEAASIAADFVCKCIENTIGDESHWYGVKFETALPYLIGRLAE